MVLLDRSEVCSIPLQVYFLNRFFNDLKNDFFQNGVCLGAP
jgi:hypothetical protein